MATNIPDILRTTSSGSQARLYSICSILRISDGHKSQSGIAYTRHCLRSSRVRLIRSRRPLPASLNGPRIATTPRQMSLYGYTNVSSRSFSQNSATGYAYDDNLKMMYPFTTLQASSSMKFERIFFGTVVLHTSCRT